LPPPEESDLEEAPPDGPWSDGVDGADESEGKTFLPPRPPIELGRAPPEGGPWGPRGPWGLRRR
jgi:hypothetical protein